MLSEAEKRHKNAARQRDWRAKNPERSRAIVRRYYHKDIDRSRLYHRNAAADNLARTLAGYARERAKRWKRPFDLYDHLPEIQTRLDKGFCELSGVPFTRFGKVRGPFSASIDRINSKLGYTYDNIRIICTALNTALGNWGEEVLLQILDAYHAKLMKVAPLTDAPTDHLLSAPATPTTASGHEFPGPALH